MDYKEKLRDPRWQKKRLRVLNRDKWKCKCCGNKELTLMVHHFQYKKNKNPWDYNLKELFTLCEDCHKNEHELRSWCEKLLNTILQRKRFFSSDIHTLTSFFEWGIDDSDLEKKFILFLHKMRKWSSNELTKERKGIRNGQTGT